MQAYFNWITTSFDTPEHANATICQVKSCLKAECFHLTQFVSNQHEAIDNIALDDPDVSKVKQESSDKNETWKR